MLCTEKKRLLDLIITHNPLKPVELKTAVKENDRDLTLVKDYSHHIVVCAPTDPAPSLHIPVNLQEEGTLYHDRGRCNRFQIGVCTSVA